MLNIEIKTKFDKHSKITKLAIISSNTRWNAKVTKYGLFEDVTWTLYSGQLVIKSGKAFFFNDALFDATTTVEQYMNDPLFK